MGVSDATGSAAFVPFGPDHVAVVLIAATAVGCLIAGRKRLQAVDDRWLRRALAALLLGNELISFAVGAAQGRVRIPFHFCDGALVLSIWALLSLRRSVSELAYFFGLAGSLQAVLTPDLREPFPTYWWMKFFVGHCGIVLTAVYLAASGRVQPTHRSVWRAWGWANVYVLVAGTVNWAFGANYGYLARKPMHPSLLDHFGPWPYYILVLELVGVASFYLCYAPFAFGRGSTRRIS